MVLMRISGFPGGVLIDLQRRLGSVRADTGSLVNTQWRAVRSSSPSTASSNKLLKWGTHPFGHGLDALELMAGLRSATLRQPLSWSLRKRPADQSLDNAVKSNLTADQVQQMPSAR